MDSGRTEISFDLITTTIGRTSELEALLASLDAQEHRQFRLLIVDQNEDDRLAALVAQDRSFPVVRLRSNRGVSRGRNAALPFIEADLVAFPDDDCRYGPDLLSLVASRFADASLDGITGRLVDSSGIPEKGSWRPHGFTLDPRSVWYGAVSATIFVRAEVAARVGTFDERLGLGSAAGPRSGEEIDYVVRALLRGASITFDPTLVVEHRPKDERERWSASRAARDGTSIGYILRKHRYPATFIGRMLIRPAGGALLSALRGDVRRARFHAATLTGRVRGLLDSSAGEGRCPS